jgi:hypothetical protein
MQFPEGLENTPFNWKYFVRRFAPHKTFLKFAKTPNTIPLPLSPNKTLYSPQEPEP